jgi:hypothetical protein
MNLYQECSTGAYPMLGCFANTLSPVSTIAARPAVPFASEATSPSILTRKAGLPFVPRTAFGTGVSDEFSIKSTFFRSLFIRI